MEYAHPTREIQRQWPFPTPVALLTVVLPLFISGRTPATAIYTKPPAVIP